MYGVEYTKKWVFGVFGLVIILYSAVQASKLLLGPQITLASPISGMTYTTPLIDVVGVAKNSSSLSINNKKVYTDRKGNFKEKLLLLPGYNIIVLDAQDSFGKRQEKKVEIILQES